MPKLPIAWRRAETGRRLWLAIRLKVERVELTTCSPCILRKTITVDLIRILEECKTWARFHPTGWPKRLLFSDLSFLSSWLFKERTTQKFRLRLIIQYRQSLLRWSKRLKRLRDFMVPRSYRWNKITQLWESNKPSKFRDIIKMCSSPFLVKCKLQSTIGRAIAWICNRISLHLCLSKTMMAINSRL